MRNTILIVEDDEMVRQGIVDALQLRNWKTDVAATCEEAEKKIKEDTYMVQLAYNDSNKDRITAAVYYTSDLFTKRLAALKLEYKLSNRDFEIIYLSLKRSLTNAEIAQELFISEATVKRHLYTVYQKIGINNQKQLFHELQMI